MDGSSAPPSDSNHTDGGASKFLTNLPSRGLFSSTVLSSNPGGMRVYICDHDTSPPEDQLIKTNQMNILIRSLKLKKQKGDSSPKDVKGITANENSRKRAADRTLDGRASAKRSMTNSQIGCQQEGSKSRSSDHVEGSKSRSSDHVERSKSRLPDKDIQNLTVERLRALLKEKGLCLKGKKDELIARLRGLNG